MIASRLISSNILPLKTSDTGDEALTSMGIHLVKHLPIVNNDQLLGLISEEDILSHDVSEPIGANPLSLIRSYVYGEEHLFEIMSKMAQNHLTLIPVVDKEENYMGVITQNDLLQFYAVSYSFAEPGSILILESSKIDYSLADIARIIESEEASILSTFLTTESDSNKVLITLKVNRQEVSRIISTLNRHDYVVRGSFSDIEYYDELKERYDALIHYLNV